jgi:hypothetical protein
VTVAHTADAGEDATLANGEAAIACAPHAPMLLVMSVMIQIRHVPDEPHRLLKARAEEAGTSLSDYLLLELRRTVERPTREQLMARLKRRSRVVPKERPAGAVRAERNAR